MVYGVLEIALLFLVVLIVPPEPTLLTLFQAVYLVAGALLFGFSIRIGHYQYAPVSEVRGRFRRRATL